MDAAVILAKAAYGYGVAGSKLGLPHAWYRPQNSGPAIIPANQLGSLPFAASATSKGDFARPATPTQMDWYALLDTSQTAIGDYFVGPDGTWFLAEQGLLTAPVARLCNAVLSGFRYEGDAATLPAAAPSSGWTGYSGGTTPVAYVGDTKATETPLFQEWPARVLIGGGHAENARVTLPGNAKEAGYTAYLPPIPGVVLREADRLRADDGGDFLISGAESTARGWRLLLINVAS